MSRDPRPKLTKRLAESQSTTNPSGERIYCGQLPGFGCHYFPSGRRTWFVEYVPPSGGRARRRMKLGDFQSMTCEQARTEAIGVLGMVRAGVDPLDQRAEQREAGTFAEWKDRYLQLGEASGRWTPRVKGDVSAYLRRAAEAFGRRRLAEVSAHDLEVFRDRVNRESGRTSANKALSAVKACLRDAWKRGLIDTHPCDRVPRIEGEMPRTRTLSEPEMQTLMKALEALDNPYFRVGLLWLALTGARKSEVLRAGWADLRLDPPSRAEWTIPRTKSGTPGVRPIPAPIALEILGLPRESPLVIGHRLPSSTFAHYWIQLRRRAGLPEDIHLHDLRRTAGLWIARTAGLQAAQRLLGHSDISTTARVYTPLSVDDLRGAQNQAVAKILPFRKAQGEEK